MRRLVCNCKFESKGVVVISFPAGVVVSTFSFRCLSWSVVVSVSLNWAIFEWCDAR